MSHQNARFFQQTETWKKMINENVGREFIFVGDFNIDAAIFYKSETEKTSAEKIYNTMVGYIKSVFFDNNIKIINRKPTRTEANKKSVLDHFYTNHPKKIKCVEQNDDTNSDHSMLKILRHMKLTQSEEQYTFTRDYKKIDFDRVNQETRRQRSLVAGPGDVLRGQNNGNIFWTI